MRAVTGFLFRNCAAQTADHNIQTAAAGTVLSGKRG